MTMVDPGIHIWTGGDNGVVVTPVAAPDIEIGVIEHGPKGEKGDQGEQGPPGADANWTKITQEGYDALLVKDPYTLYVIVG
jgi:hypothetical protein